MLQFLKSWKIMFFKQNMGKYTKIECSKAIFVASGQLFPIESEKGHLLVWGHLLE